MVDYIFIYWCLITGTGLFCGLFGLKMLNNYIIFESGSKSIAYSIAWMIISILGFSLAFYAF